MIKRLKKIFNIGNRNRYSPTDAFQGELDDINDKLETIFVVVKDIERSLEQQKSSYTQLPCAFPYPIYNIPDMPILPSLPTESLSKDSSPKCNSTLPCTTSGCHITGKVFPTTINNEKVI